ncbi:hypothetical protein [Salmonella bongori]|uniref:hypothetical protein n=1 Tax=Salmonella bongori TaxID=54736 RepID=UPI0015C4A92C|nr:hypothetical protein [Salmonella bongori]EGE4653498.1 hypothetical protein [Salmonella bongori serovar 40:z35:- str. 95-0123]EGE4659421.1 hypothetical protein [Salmonella bongori serovar 48:i:- str. 94-0708]QVP37971.1 hypothetical protein AIT23_02850 [Salmonella bongori serovar 40:z35:-]
MSINEGGSDKIRYATTLPSSHCADSVSVPVNSVAAPSIMLHSIGLPIATAER